MFRLHGHRSGTTPPENECGRTNGFNEIWHFATTPERYDAIASVMFLRESLRPYVKQINAETSRHGVPMMRPMFLQFPNDETCQSSDVEDQYMFGPDWLVKPVTIENATSVSV